MYSYKEYREKLLGSARFGPETLSQISRNVENLLSKRPAFIAHEAMRDCSGDGWMMLAALDYLIETGRIIRLGGDPSVFAQDEIYVGKKEIVDFLEKPASTEYAPAV